MAAKTSRLKSAFAGRTSGFKAEVERVMRTDGWINALTGLGGTRDRAAQACVANFRVLTVPELEAMYHGDDLPAKIVDAVIKDALRQGFEIKGDEDSETLDALRAWKVPALVQEAATWGRLYGIGAVLIGTDESTGAMDEPLDLATMREGSLQYLMALDRQSLSIVDYDEDPTSPDFGEPRTFRLSLASATGSFHEGSLIHASRLIRFGGATTSERVRLQRNAGFDLSVLQRPAEILRDVDQTWRSIMNLIHDMSQAVFAIDGLIDMIAEGEKDVMLQRMEVVDMARSVARAVIIDAESESFEHKGAANVGGVPPLVWMTLQRLAAAACMPLTKLLGMSPAGLNATGESDIRMWYDEVGAYRDTELTPALQTLVRVVEAHEGRALPEDEEPEIEWPSLWQPTPPEQADLDKKEAETFKIWIDAGVMFPEEVALAKFQDDPDFAEVMDFDLREEKLEEPEPETPEITPEMAAAMAAPPPGAPAEAPPGPPEAPEPPDEA
jgi:phage-related protein (TIGR01555 family)